MKKKIKIFCFPAHMTKERTSGVDYARIIQPMKALNGYKDEEVEFQVDIFDVMEEETTEWDKVAEKYDIIYLNYINNPWAFAAMGAMARKNGVKIVLDLDDALFNIRSDNPAHNVYKKGSDAIRNFIAICNEVDYMTTTNDYLKHVIMNNTKKKAPQIKVFPNYIDLDLYKHRSPFKNDGQIQLMHFGSSTHYIDLSNDEFAKGIDRILSEYPNVTFRSIGAFMPKFRGRWGMRYEQVYGHQDLFKWISDFYPGYMDEADILVVPLDVDIYNKSKSSIKYLEASAAKIPGVYQRIRQYEEIIDEGKNGMLAGKASEWYKGIKKLIDDVELRRSMGEAAFKNVQDNWQVKNHTKEYADFFKEILIA